MYCVNDSKIEIRSKVVVEHCAIVHQPLSHSLVVRSLTQSTPVRAQLVATVNWGIHPSSVASANDLLIFMMIYSRPCHRDSMRRLSTKIRHRETLTYTHGSRQSLSFYESFIVLILYFYLVFVFATYVKVMVIPGAEVYSACRQYDSDT